MKSGFVLGTIVGVVVVVGLGVAAAAPTAAQKCQAAKLKEVGKYDACRLKAEATAVIKATTPDTSKCDSKFTTNWGKIEAKAAGACPTTGDVTPIGGDVATHVADIVVALSGASPAACGNNVVEGAEACDGTDLAGETCVTQGYDGGTLSCDSLCTLNTTTCAMSCDPLAQACPVGQGCYTADTSIAVCAGSGSVALGAACTYLNDCSAGAVCTGVCSQYCDTTAPSCPAATSCTSIGFVPYPDTGVCL